MNILIAHLFAPSIDSAQREGAFFIAAILLFLQELGLAVGWITWLVWIAGIERYLTLLGRALQASPFRRAALRAKGAEAERGEVLSAYRALRARQLPVTIALVILG